MKPNEKILIVDDDPANVKLLAAKLGDPKYIIFKAYSGAEALQTARKESPDLLLLDVMMPGMNGFEVAAQLKNDPETSDIPIILVTALDGSDNKTKGLEAGADDFLNKPVHTAELKARVRSLLRLKRYSDQLKARIRAKGMLLDPLSSDDSMADLRLPNLLIVEDSQPDAKWFKSLLNSLACRITVVSSGEEALSICNNHQIDIMILDMLLPGLDGYEVVKKKAYHDKLVGSLEVAVQAAITDKLTGVYNSGYLQHYLKNELKRADRHHHPVSLLMLDIDNFKLVNDRHGHLAGDHLLKGIAETLAKSVRDIDFVARLGGDEFAIILPYTQKENAAAVAERIRCEIANGQAGMNDQALQPVSLSIGVADYVPGVDTVQDMIQKADNALYTAKFNGKNRVCSTADTFIDHPAVN